MSTKGISQDFKDLFRVDTGRNPSPLPKPYASLNPYRSGVRVLPRATFVQMDYSALEIKIASMYARHWLSGFPLLRAIKRARQRQRARLAPRGGVR